MTTSFWKLRSSFVQGRTWVVIETYETTGHASEHVNNFDARVATSDDRIRSGKSSTDNQHRLHVRLLLTPNVLYRALQQRQLVFQPRKRFVFSADPEAVHKVTSTVRQNDFVAGN